jgi:hypothetical protein
MGKAEAHHGACRIPELLMRFFNPFVLVEGGTQAGEDFISKKKIGSERFRTRGPRQG